MNTFENEMYVCLAETFFHAENVDILWYMCSADHNYVVLRKDRRLTKQVVKHDKKESLMIWNGMRFFIQGVVWFPRQGSRIKKHDTFTNEKSFVYVLNIVVHSFS